MCISDYRIARLIRTTCRKVTAQGVGNIVLANPSLQRVGIRFCMDHASPAANIFCTIDGTDFEILNFFTGTLMWHTFTIENSGNLPQRAWLFHSDLNVPVVTVTEFWLPEEVLYEPTEKLHSRDKLWPS